MSINRLLLRLATLAALTKQEGEVAHPTIAGEMVCDSRVDPIQFEEDQIELPIIAVYTDDDAMELVDTGSGRGTYNRTVKLRIDIAIGSFMKKVVDTETQVSYGVPSTDAEMELLLDLFEAQVWRALNTPGRTVSDAWNRRIKRFMHIRSSANRDSETNNKLAARSIDIDCLINQDCFPNATSGLPNTLTAENILQQLPWVSGVFPSVTNPGGYDSLLPLLNDLAGGTSIALPPLTKLSTGIHSAPQTEPSVLDALRQGKTPPRGAIHVLQNWKFQA